MAPVTHKSSALQMLTMILEKSTRGTPAPAAPRPQAAPPAGLSYRPPAAAGAAVRPAAPRPQAAPPAGSSRRPLAAAGAAPAAPRPQAAPPAGSSRGPGPSGAGLRAPAIAPVPRPLAAAPSHKRGVSTQPGSATKGNFSHAASAAASADRLATCLPVPCSSAVSSSLLHKYRP